MEQVRRLLAERFTAREPFAEATYIAQPCADPDGACGLRLTRVDAGGAVRTVELSGEDRRAAEAALVTLHHLLSPPRLVSARAGRDQSAEVGASG